MKIRNTKGRILRIRPGHLANFSGGAGYMPFIVIISVPASFLFNIIGSLILHFRGRHLLKRGMHATGLHEYVRYAHRHTLTCIIIAIVAGVVLFCFGQRMVYATRWPYVLQYIPLTVIFAAGPFAAWIVSTIVLWRLIERGGARWTNLLIAAAFYLVVLAVCFFLSMIYFAITGA